MTVFGSIFSANQLEEAAIATLQLWFPTYLREIERQVGLAVGELDTPKNYSNRNSFDTERGEETPKIVAISPGIIGQPRKNGSGKYSAIWQLGIGIAFAAKTEAEANAKTKNYASAIRALIVQQPKLDGTLNIIEVVWFGEQYVDLPIPNRVELFRSASLMFHFEIMDIVSKRGGPEVPVVGSDPPPEYGEVQRVIIAKDKLP